MSDLTITAKVQIHPDKNFFNSLDESMEQYRLACNYISDYCFEHKCLKRETIHNDLYPILRTLFGLKSQMACSTIITVIAKYKSILEQQHTWIKANFKKPQLDLVWNRDYSLVQGVFSVNTLSGRIKAPFNIKGMEQYFDKDKYKFGTARLIQDRNNKYYLHIPVTTQVEELQVSEISHVVGIDRGINFLAVSYDSKGKSTFFDGGKIKHKRAHYKELRTELQ